MGDKIKELIRKHIENNYYCDSDDEGFREIWQPFELWTYDEIDDQIDTDCIVLEKFLIKNKEAIIKFLGEVK